MKRRDLVKALTENGFELFRHGSNHDIYKKEKKSISIPRHQEINEVTAKEIIKEAGLT